MLLTVGVFVSEVSGSVGHVHAAESTRSVEEAFQALLKRDDKALSEVDQWIKNNRKFQDKTASIRQATLDARIRQRLSSVEEAYKDFISRHPEHVRAHLAYGSFLNDLAKPDKAKEQWMRARKLAPKNPAAWNNLANYYGQEGEAKKAFTHYEKAISLRPGESVYYHNLASVILIYPDVATDHYQMDKQAVFEKALNLYRQAIKRDPTDFPLATDLARTFYRIKPPRPDQAIKAWERALNVANDAIERQGVYIHLARWKIQTHAWDKAREYLDKVKHPMYKKTKARVRKQLSKVEKAQSEQGDENL